MDTLRAFLPVHPMSQGGNAIGNLPASRVRVLLRDYTHLLGQQMYFWGRDVLHPRGNLLCENGFERRRSTGLQGTSCYRKPLEGGGFVELHGACAGHYDPSQAPASNFLYIRERGRCYLYSGGGPPAPGRYGAETLRGGPAEDLYAASLRFLDWWLGYEDWIARETSPDWRKRNYDAFASLPASRPSLPPREAVRWLCNYRKKPAKVTRVREEMRSLKRR